MCVQVGYSPLLWNAEMKLNAPVNGRNRPLCSLLPGELCIIVAITENAMLLLHEYVFGWCRIGDERWELL